MDYEMIRILDKNDIPSEHRNSPIGALISYHNLSESFKTHIKAEMLIGTCIDNRIHLSIPHNFAYIVRTGGGNLRYSEFKLSYAIAIGGVRHVALIAHDQCGMAGLISKKNEFVEGICKLPGWDAKRAEEYFLNYAPMFEIGNEADFVVEETKRLGSKFRGVCFIPLYYTVEDNKLSLIKYGE